MTENEYDTKFHKLCNKMDTELEEFKKNLICKGIDAILENAYEYKEKEYLNEYIINNIANAYDDKVKNTEKVMDYLLDCENTLDYVYEKFNTIENQFLHEEACNNAMLDIFDEVEEIE